MDINEIMEIDEQYYMKVFTRTPVCFDHGSGIHLWDTGGKRYTDLFAGIAVNALGYAHPALVKAIREQSEKIIHCSSLYYIESQAMLAKLLADNSCLDRVFFANSGAEANEGAIKLARIYFKKKELPDRYGIIALKKSFHGRTLTTLAATGQEKYHKPFAPLIPGFKHVPLNDLDALKDAISEETCAVMMEPIQGESGVMPADMEYVKAVRKLCDEKGLLLIFDEIQTGMGRTGKLFAYEHFNVEPDIMTLAKALAGGVPIGAVLAKEHVAAAFGPGDHGSTFGGNPLACSAGVAVMKTLFEEKLIENSEKMGSCLKGKLQKLSEKYPLISEVRGMGLMIGVQLAKDLAVDLKGRLFEKGFIVGSIGPDILRLVPPLIISGQDIDSFIETLDAILAAPDYH